MAKYRCPRCADTFELPGYEGTPSCGACLDSDSRVVKVERLRETANRAITFHSVDVTAAFGGVPVVVTI